MSANYYVITNTRGDVTQLYDEAGSLQVAYTVDFQGRILSVKDGSGNEIADDTNVGRLNSLRYRGYYYDEETGLYYLQSRYYDPETCRFINGDDSSILFLSAESILGTNLFAYCLNNPIIRSDKNGYFSINIKIPKWAFIYGIELLFTAILGVGTRPITKIFKEKIEKWGKRYVTTLMSKELKKKYLRRLIGYKVADFLINALPFAFGILCAATDPGEALFNLINSTESNEKTRKNNYIDVKYISFQNILRKLGF